MKMRQVSVVTGVWVCLAVAPALCIAQQKAQSLAEAAQKTKEQQKQTTKASVVWTNDNLPTSGGVNVVGQPVASSGAQGNASAVAAQAAPNPAAANGDQDKMAAGLTAAQKDLASAKTDLDFAQREYKLDSDQFYSSPDFASNLQGQAKLNGDKSQVSAKQQAVDAAQKRVDALQKQLDQMKDKSTTTAPPKS